MLVLRSRTMLQGIANAPKNRVGFLLETGAAQVLRVPQNRVSQARGARRSVWVSPIFRPSAPLDVAGLIRVNSDRELSIRSIDVGIRLGANSGGVYYSVESAYRLRFADVEIEEFDRDNGRVVAGFTYAFNRATQVNFTIGKNYSDDFTRSGSLLASFGLTVGLGEVPLGSVSAFGHD